MDGVPPDPDPLDVGAILEKLVRSRFVGVLYVSIGVNVGLLASLADDVSRQLTPLDNVSQYMQKGLSV